MIKWLILGGLLGIGIKEMATTARLINNSIDELFDEQTEPQRGCDADCNEDCNECAKESADWKDQMWAEAVEASKDEPQTDCKECKYAWWNSDMKRYECSISKCPYNEQTEPQTDVYDYKGNGKWERSE